MLHIINLGQEEMIFGKKSPSLDEMKKIKAAKIHNWFAWRPMLLVDGRWVWMQKIWREYWSSRAGCGHSYYLTQSEVEDGN